MVSGTRDKKTGIRTRGAVVNSDDSYSLLIQKRLDPADTMNYFIFLHAASRVKLSDSMLNSKGAFELFLADGKKLELGNAMCENDPLGFGAAIAFTVRTSGATVEQLIDNPIEKVRVFGILETAFSLKKQKQIQRILVCLKNEQPAARE